MNRSHKQKSRKEWNATSQADCTSILQLLAPQESLELNKGRRSGWELEKPQQCPHVPAGFPVWGHWSWMRISVPLALSALTSGPCELMATWGGRRAGPAVTDTGDGGIFFFHRAVPSAPGGTSEISWDGFTEHGILQWPGRDLKDFDTTTLFCVPLSYFVCLRATFCSHLHFVSTGSLSSGVLAEASSNVSSNSISVLFSSLSFSCFV